jgi:HAE1 family hydrophobic/amphiphilic exporter-1
MTSFAFILGIVPLVIASGAGSSSRHSLGTPVLGGMVLSTFLNLVLVPVIYVVVSNIRDGRKRHGGTGNTATREQGTETSELAPVRG